jgi:hypothetical protein
MPDSNENFYTSGTADQGTPEQREVNWVADPNKAQELANMDQQRINREEEMRQVTELGTEAERKNIEIMEGLLEKYPTAIEVLTLDNNTKVAFFEIPSKLAYQFDQYQSRSKYGPGIVVFSKYGLTHIKTPKYTQLRPLIVPTMGKIATQQPDHVVAATSPNQGDQQYFLDNSPYGNCDLADHHPKGFLSERIPKTLNHKYLGEIMRRTEDKLLKEKRSNDAPGLSPVDVLKEMP